MCRVRVLGLSSQYEADWVQLLTHIAGLRDGFGGDYEPMTRDQIVAAILKSDLHHEPGTVHAYSNAGNSLLGAIIEIVSGEPYEKFLCAQLLEPAGMLQTGYKFPRWSKEKLCARLPI